MIWFGAAYYPEHRDPARWDHDLDRMAEAHVNALRCGEFAWKRFEPRAGVYDFEWMDRFVAKAARRGIRILMCPPLRTAPAWLVERDPSVLILDERGTRLAFGSRYTFCVNHPLLRERGGALAAEMARHYAGEPGILGWHLDNEFGDEPDCHCPLCAERFRAWLGARYGSVAALNERWGNVFWGLEYDDFRQVPTPAVSKTVHNPAHLLAWRRFRSDCTNEVVGLQADAVRRHDALRRPVTTNNQSWHFRVDYQDMARHLDLHGTNYYPPYGESARSQAHALALVRGYRQRNFWLLELRCGPHAVPLRQGNAPEPGEVERLTAHVVGNGADGVFYFRWRACPFGAEQTHGTITDYDGRPTAIFDEVRRTGERLRRLAPLLEGTSVRADAALLHDIPTRWIMAGGAEWQGPGDLYPKTLSRLHDALRSLGYGADAVSPRADLARYRVLVVPFLACADDALAARLAAWVRAGGTLVWHPLSGLKDADGRIHPDRLHPALGALFGVDVRSFTTADAGDTVALSFDGRSFACGAFLDFPVPGAGVRVRAAYASGWMAGRPAVTERREGAGRAIYCGTLGMPAFYEAFLGAVLAESGVEPLLGSVPPREVEVVERRASDGRRLVFVLNTSPRPQQVALPWAARDVWNDEDVAARADLAPWQVRVLRPG